jgi:UDP-4-amino-4,6-dideoxy-N-acetyl-beta-L-altrosamine transaminase
MTDRPFLPYARQSVDDDDIAAVVEVLRSDYLTTGPAIPAFEGALADAVGAAWAVAVSSGTAALHAACSAAGLGPGDEVIVPAVTFLATANCARYVGAEPVFADVDPDTGLIDVQAAAARTSERTRAIIAVHLAGASADIAGLAALAERAGAVLIEDAAHALGGDRRGAHVGSCGDGARMATFSFHPVKHITTGEGGAVTGNDPELLHRLRRFREHGIERAAERFEQASPGPWYYEMQALGHNARLTDVQAALGRSQLGRLTRFIERRRVLARAYDRRLRAVPGVTPAIGDASRDGCAYHLYPVLVDFAACGTTRAAVMEYLREQNIGTQVHYIPLTMQPYYRRRGWDPDAFPGARRYYQRTLSLPMFPAMDDRDVERVVAALAIALDGRGLRGRR